MNGKIVAAFIAGAVIASGIVYMAVRPLPQPATVAYVRPVPEISTPPPPAPPAVAAEPTAPPAEPPRSKTPEVAPAPKAAPKPVTQRPKLSHNPIREKPSPMPPVIRQEPATIAREVAPSPSIPEPVPVAQAEPQVPRPVVQPAPATPPPPPPAPTQTATENPDASSIRVPHHVLLAAGTPLTVRVSELVSAAQNQAGDTFVSTLEQPLVIDGFIIAERGSRALGKITEAVPAGRGGGQSHLSVELVQLSTSDGQRVTIATDPYVKQGSNSTGSDLAKVGAGAAIGAAIGAIAGGGKGAAIGAGAGAAAGTGAVLISNGKSVEIPVESRLTFRVHQSITLTERLD